MKKKLVFVLVFVSLIGCFSACKKEEKIYTSNDITVVFTYEETDQEISYLPKELMTPYKQMTIKHTGELLPFPVCKAYAEGKILDESKYGTRIASKKKYNEKGEFDQVGAMRSKGKYLISYEVFYLDDSVLGKTVTVKRIEVIVE